MRVKLFILTTRVAVMPIININTSIVSLSFGERLRERSKGKGYFIFIIGILISLTSCEKIIDVKLDKGTSQLAVSAFIDSKPGIQTIVLSKTGGYFDNVPCPPAIGANVQLIDNNGNTFNFYDNTGEGYYKYSPAVGDTMIRAGNLYILSISYNGEEYSAVSGANPVPLIDSLNYMFKKGNNPAAEKSYYASFHALDIKGRPDFYWVKSFRNGSLLSPLHPNLSIDGAVGGPGGDGLPFIVPVRESINPFEGFSIGDTCSVEVHSISVELYYFFLHVHDQTHNGGLFATPPANVSTNIHNVNSNSPVKAVGFFNVAMVSKGGIKIK